MNHARVHTHTHTKAFTTTTTHAQTSTQITSRCRLRIWAFDALPPFCVVIYLLFSEIRRRQQKGVQELCTFNTKAISSNRHDFGVHEYWQLFVSMFVHIGNWMGIRLLRCASFIRDHRTQEGAFFFNCFYEALATHSYFCRIPVRSEKHFVNNSLNWAHSLKLIDRKFCSESGDRWLAKNKKKYYTCRPPSSRGTLFLGARILFKQSRNSRKNRKDDYNFFFHFIVWILLLCDNAEAYSYKFQRIWSIKGRMLHVGDSLFVGRKKQTRNAKEMEKQNMFFSVL